MSQLNDEILRATGGATINDGLSTWFSRTTTESLNDAESRWLAGQGVAIANLNDMWFERLSPFYSGSLNDMKFGYWSDQ